MSFVRFRLPEIYRFALPGLILCVSFGAGAHPSLEYDRAQGALFRWIHALSAADNAVFEEVTAPEMTWATLLPGRRTEQARDQLIRNSFVSRFHGARISLTQAQTEFTDGLLHVDDILVEFPGDIVSRLLSVTVARYGTAWRVASVEQSMPLPETAAKFYKRDLPEQVATVPVAFSMRDGETGEPVYARVHIADHRGRYWPPRGHPQEVPNLVNVDVGGDVLIGNRIYAYVRPDFVADLAPGDYTIVAYKGMDYFPVATELTVEDAIEQGQSLLFDRWIDLTEEGWYAGDTHVHFLDDHHALIEAAAEGLNVISVLATKWRNTITDVHRIVGAPSPVSGNNLIVFFNEETRHNFLGHTILHPIREPIYPLSWGDIPEGVSGGGDYPTLAHQADKARAQGGIVTWAHFPDPQGELAVDAALGKIDSVDLITWGDPFSPPRITVPGTERISPVAWWYKLLNTGSRLPATGGTDKMGNSQVVGSVRTYAYLGSARLTYDAWADAIRSGRTFVTSGPVLSFGVNGQPLGSVLEASAGDSLSLDAVVRAPRKRFPWDRFEIVFNGEVIAEATDHEGRDEVRIQKEFTADRSGWLAARVYVQAPHRAALRQTGVNGVPPVAHTSPIYVSVPGSEVWSEADAMFLAASCQRAIDWARNRANYHRPQEREEVVALFEQAKAHYENGPLNAD